ncbi:MAG: anaerobic ribonucleoside-triphosphate reductase activating protein [Elusimicrobia bacterium]|nr:anaerobic ribonucleoside-triphosphate reductase activating protein [Elusimicrobiota bacterium]
MHIGGLLKFSLIDYPGKVAAVVFTQGCNYRCPFCHNPELVLPELFHEPIPEAEVFSFLEKRRGQLQGVTVTGGEPTLHPDLIPFLQRIKSLGYLVKLDTNGSRPDVVEEIVSLGCVDYLAMDIKTSPENYCKATGVAADIEAVQRSIRIIRGSGIAHQFRTTTLKSLVAEKDLKAIQALIGPDDEYRLQAAQLKTKVLDYASLADVADYLPEEIGALKAFYENLPDRKKEAI